MCLLFHGITLQLCAGLFSHCSESGGIEKLSLSFMISHLSPSQVLWLSRFSICMLTTSLPVKGMSAVIVCCHETIYSALHNLWQLSPVKKSNSKASLYAFYLKDVLFEASWP